MSAAPLPRSPTTPPRAGAACRLATGCAVAAAVLFAFAVSQRLCYPHELEWMEGAMVDHASRIANGLPVYCAPGPEHVPYLYAPLMFWLGGLLMKLGVPGLLALRGIAALATLAAAWIIARWVQRETTNARVGMVAAGLFLAGYGWLSWWFDLARNDSLCVALAIGGAFVMRHGTVRRWLPAALLCSLAVLAKQSAVGWIVAILVGASCRDWRSALRCATATFLLTSATLLALHTASDGWSTFFLFELPRHHTVFLESWAAFWTHDNVVLLPLIALAVVATVGRWRAGRRGDALELAAFVAGALLLSWLSRLHIGGYVNVLMPGLAGLCVLGPMAATTTATRLGSAVPWLLLAQFVLLGVAAVLRGQRLLPAAEHQHAHEELAAFVQAQPGPVWVLGHGGISSRLGKGTGAHGQAIFDLLLLLPRRPDQLLDAEALDDPTRLAHLSPRARQALTNLADGVKTALFERHFAAVVVDEVGTNQWTIPLFAGMFGRDGLPGSADDPYGRLPQPLLSRPEALHTGNGYRLEAPFAMVRRQ